MRLARQVGWFVLRLVAVPPAFVLVCVLGAVYWLGKFAAEAAVFVWTGEP